MARNTHRPIVLLSIEPKYASAIMAGDKRVEFRRVRCREDIQIAVVYATSPVQRLVGYFEVAFVVEGTPEELWAKYGDVGGISENEYWDYYAGASKAVAIGVGKARRLHRGKPLSKLRGPTTPPQSYQYLSRAAVDRLSAAAS